MRSIPASIVLVSAALGALGALTTLGACGKSECKPTDPPKACACADGAQGTQACVDEKWAACACAKPPSDRLPGVQGAGLVGGGKEVPSEFCKNNCKGAANTCKATGVGEPGSCEKEFNDCIARCPQ